jgi:hypothetical protein
VQRERVPDKIGRFSTRTAYGFLVFRANLGRKGVPGVPLPDLGFLIRRIREIGQVFHL